MFLFFPDSNLDLKDSGNLLLVDMLSLTCNVKNPDKELKKTRWPDGI